MKSDRIRKDCFKVGNALTFNAAREMAKSEESAEKQLQLINTEVHSINAPKGYQGLKNQRRNTGSGKSQACRNCGWGPHSRDLCPAKNATFHYCRKVGHLAKSESPLGSLPITEPTSVLCKIDSGAETKIIPTSLYNRLAPRVMNLQKPTTKLTAYGGTEIPSLGICRVYVKGPNSPEPKVIQAEVVDVDGPPIIGNISAQSLNLLKLNWAVAAKVAANQPVSPLNYSTHVSEVSFGVLSCVLTRTYSTSSAARYVCLGRATKLCPRFILLKFCLSVPKNCAQLYKYGKITSGVYMINPDHAGPDFAVFCDQTTDGGGWTVVQKRLDGSVIFDLSWSDYKNGFGNLKGEFWLGLDKIHRLTKSTTKLRVDLEDFHSKTAYTVYDMFAVADESKKYRLSVSKYSGTAGDSLIGHHGYSFSTKDQDNDSNEGVVYIWNSNSTTTEQNLIFFKDTIESLESALERKFEKSEQRFQTHIHNAIKSLANYDQTEQDLRLMNVNGYYKFNLKIGHLNINPLQNKLDEVKNILNKYLFDIFFISETKLDGTTSDSFLQQLGYRTILRDRKRGTGGLIAFVREDLPVCLRRNLEPESVESLCLDVMDSKKARFIVCACYISPKFCKITDFLSSLTSAIELMYTSRQEILLIGDFNIDLLVGEHGVDAEDNSLMDLCDSGDQLPWITPLIQREISRRNRLFKKHARSSTTTSWEEFKEQRNKVTSLKRKGLKAFCMEASSNTKHHGEFWNKLRPLFPSKENKQSKIILIENERVTTDSLMVAEMFNNYFCEASRSDGDSKEMVEFVDHPSVILIAEKTCDDVFDLVPVDVGYIRKILDTLDPRKAVGCDKISQRLLRLSSPVIAEPVPV
ncbi:Fibrinogen C domain-containing protein 1-A [Stylophora pistillata]|uniref:Fibrinogen C domain-containing protein 1-A n=1 Tax=Stylophora pistillata TaxID=50429 RepID=A0A2B4SM14_STYPI|nr:Fibrinogen C domain-containing protein 1-A [Stylophora pistillata]